MTRHSIGTGLLLAMTAASAVAQVAPPSGAAPLELAVLQHEARAADARTREIDLLAKQTDLREKNIDAEQLPALSTLGQTQYQSDAPVSPFPGPNGQPAFGSPLFTYDLSLRIDQRIYDPSSQARRDLARADLAESQARVRTSLFTLRQEVNEAFFAAALLQEQIGVLDATIANFEARLREANTRVREGAAVPADAAAIEAALLQQRQQADALRANRRAALRRLETLAGHAIDPDAAAHLPDLHTSVAQAREALTRERARPEYQQFDRAREKTSRQQALMQASDRPQLSAFGRGGYGRPGLDFISDQAEWYGLGGVQFQWKAWTWNSSAREREAIGLQQKVVDAEEAAFTSGLHRAIETDLASIDHLETAIPVDDRIVALREGIDRTAKARLDEGAITASEYVDRYTEWLTAQFDRARHRVELAQARARVLTTLGLEVQ
jgi:outer membrane protein TolC